MTGEAQVPAGWYPQDGRQRYWDGQHWTDHTVPTGSGDQSASVVQQPNHQTGSRPKPFYAQWWFIAGAAVLALVLVVAVVGTALRISSALVTERPVRESVVEKNRAGGDEGLRPPSGDATDEGPSDAPGEARGTAGTGDTARDGKFEFIVSKVEKGQGRIGSADFGVSPQGQFVLVHITVKNVGKEPQTLYTGNQFLFDAEDRKFSANAAAAVYLDSARSLYEKINPGNTLQGTVVFDLPKGAVPTEIELHESVLSPGVKVRLG
jgi:Domain of unknown function (DUF4352)/Protein of unknown function (DUF2510)